MMIHTDHIDQTVLVSQLLRELGIPVHRIGYRQLCMAILLYSNDVTQSITKELYPRIAMLYGYSDWHPVERAIRSAIHDAWARRDPDLWCHYFQDCSKVPSNKMFILDLVECINKTPLP